MIIIICMIQVTYPDTGHMLVPGVNKSIKKGHTKGEKTVRPAAGDIAQRNDRQVDRS